MPRSQAAISRPYSKPAVLLALLVALLLAAPAAAAACDTEPGEVTGPLITEAKLSPSSLPSEGGTSAIAARVGSDCGVHQVYVEINSTEGPFVSFELLPVEDINSNARVYRGEFEVPANFQEWAVYYQVTIWAEDTDGVFSELPAGEIEVAGVPQFDEPPYISEPSVAPNLFGGFGGPALIGVTATDNRAISNAYAVITYPDNSERQVGLEAVSSSRFEAGFQAPVNRTASPKLYSVAVFAEDDIGQTTGGYAGTVRVEPKGTPNPGHLSLQPRYLRFAAATLGQSASATVSLTNTGLPGSPPVSGFLRTSGAPFYLPGAEPEGVPFTLEAGEEQSFEVRFQPTVRGRWEGRLALVRTDGRQLTTGMPLFGWGVKHQTGTAPAPWAL